MAAYDPLVQLGDCGQTHLKVGIRLQDPRAATNLVLAPF